MANLKQRLVLVAALVCPWILAAQTQAYEELVQLLQDKRCPQCRLADVDLVHADLRDADLSGAELQRANLSQAMLDGADLSGADLRFTSLQGASLRGANLRGANFHGTDLRDSDLNGAQLMPMPSSKPTGAAPPACQRRRRATQHCTTLASWPQKAAAGKQQRNCSPKPSKGNPTLPKAGLPVESPERSWANASWRCRTSATPEPLRKGG